MHNETTHAHPAAGAHDGYAHGVLAARRAKDELFERSHQSPLPHERRHDFAGLVYFPPDASYRLPELRLEPLDASGTAPFPIDTSDERSRTAYRLGRLRFTLAGRALTLTAYRVGEATSDALFVPFRDATSGVQTYGAGRYLDIEPEADGTYTLDFNEAYHPYCVYSDSYSCPLPPAENHLPVRIEAGELLGGIYRTETDG
jgi:uncharacterized protein (DUF1684 family)